MASEALYFGGGSVEFLRKLLSASFYIPCPNRRRAGFVGSLDGSEEISGENVSQFTRDCITRGIEHRLLHGCTPSEEIEAI